jgi:hypothetical protein
VPLLLDGYDPEAWEDAAKAGVATPSQLPMPGRASGGGSSSPSSPSGQTSKHRVQPKKANRASRGAGTRLLIDGRRPAPVSRLAAVSQQSPRPRTVTPTASRALAAYASSSSADPNRALTRHKPQKRSIFDFAVGGAAGATRNVDSAQLTQRRPRPPDDGRQPSPVDIVQLFTKIEKFEKAAGVKLDFSLPRWSTPGSGGGGGAGLGAGEGVGPGINVIEGGGPGGEAEEYE